MSTAAFYKYQAYDAAGKMQSGQIAAESEREALRMLAGKQLIPVKLVQASATELKRGRGSRRIRQADLLDFTTGLCTLIEARVPIDKALRLLEGITESAAMRQLVVSMRRDVKEGKSLADAMEARPDVFSRMYVNIVRAGEEGGILHQLLPGLAEFLETHFQKSPGNYGRHGLSVGPAVYRYCFGCAAAGFCCAPVCCHVRGCGQRGATLGGLSVGLE